MTVSIATRLIQGLGSLSEIGAMALTFIDGGVEFLTWAVNSSSNGFDFPDETEMVGQIQQGLHASPVAWLPRVQAWVSPVKLMTFSHGDLRILARAESGADDLATANRVAAILAAQGVKTQADLAVVPVFLDELGVGGTPLLQVLSLNATILLSELITLPGEPHLQRHAAAFALAQARAPEEFSDYYRAYLALIAKLHTAHRPHEHHAADMNAAVQTLLPRMFGALECPQIPPLSSPAEVAAAVGSWSRQGRRLGFSRLSEGVCRILDSTTFTTETGAAAQQMIDFYLATAQSFLAANEVKRGRMSQDGLSCVVSAQSENLYAELLLGAGGDITLQQFRRINPPLEITRADHGEAQQEANSYQENEAGRFKWRRPR